MGYRENANMAMIVKLFVTVVFALLCLWFIWNQNKTLDAPTVNRVPPNFIALENVFDLSNGMLNYVFWENQISFFLEEDVCIYQTEVNDKDFIIKYEGKYYINATILLDKYNEFSYNQ